MWCLNVCGRLACFGDTCLASPCDRIKEYRWSRGIYNHGPCWVTQWSHRMQGDSPTQRRVLGRPTSFDRMAAFGRDSQRHFDCLSAQCSAWFLLLSLSWHTRQGKSDMARGNPLDMEVFMGRSWMFFSIAMFDYQSVIQLVILFLYYNLDAAYQQSCSSLEYLLFVCWIFSTLLSRSA